MISRRAVLFGGLGAVARCLAGRGGRRSWAAPPIPGSLDPQYLRSVPLLKLPDHLSSIVVDGLPFAPGMTGEPYPSPHARFPALSEWVRGRVPPEPTESVDVAIVGGGISGLATAYMLREHDPVLLDLNERFGGSARGEAWGGVPYSLGGAYVITPDPGTFLETLYHELGLDTSHRLDDGESEIELAGNVMRSEFWSGAGLPGSDATAFRRYAEVVTYMATERYPDIPLPECKDSDCDWILELDGKTLRQDIEDRMGMPMPPLLSAAVQAYCYSSFGLGAQEISAASGWNFLAAEEFGRWVFPGGNAQIAQRFWRALTARERPGHRGLRPGSLVIDVRLRPGGVQVTWADHDDALHSLLAKRVVLSCPKNVCRRIIHDLEALDPAKLTAMHAVSHTGYVVANILLDGPVDRDFYDIFLLRDGVYPMTPGDFAANPVVTDLLNGRFTAGPAPGPRSVLTLYWPLPWPFGQHTLIEGKRSWLEYATRLVPQARAMLALLDVPEARVRQIRMTYFGHAMPGAYPSFIASGNAEKVRRPIEDRIYFVEQDNWALPAVENCLLDAEHFVPQIEAGLG